jgi:hypothetical protein
VLNLFAPYADLLHGHDGGMNKTGTLDGVRTLAGYADTSKHGRVRFVISLKSNDNAMRFRVAPGHRVRAVAGVSPARSMFPMSALGN